MPTVAIKEVKMSQKMKPGIFAEMPSLLINNENARSR